MEKYDHQAMEDKWSKIWAENKLDHPDIAAAKKPFFNLMMFPYPSAEGMHVGNMYAFTAADIYGRYKRAQGFDVFEPIGLDGFGIHSENHALKTGTHPLQHAATTEANFYRQLHKTGNMYDWQRTVETYDPEYYHWTQWLFVQMFKAGLAYRATSNVNWCPKDKTVLADEQVIDGKCERCGTETEKKSLEQWFFRITNYAGRLLANIPSLDWSEKIKTSQTNWIGKSEGHKVKFGDVEVFTTRIDTLHGATFVALAPDHPQVIKLTVAEKRAEVGEFVKSLSTESRTIDKIKRGVFTGSFVINPATQKPIPVWVVNYVTSDYGTGAIMGVPAFDERDQEFAAKYSIAINEMQPDLAMEKYGEKCTTYHLRDWLISRQRYWGPPIPMILCPKCGWQAVPEDQLPVLLPDIADYQPKGEGKGPLADHPEFYQTTCPNCGGPATRETDVSDTFLDSSWYFLRYPSTLSVRSRQVPWDPDITKAWLPVDMYTGGPEHANLHLLYTRFVTMVMHDLGYLDFEEPFKKFFAHGMIIKDGAKMSKSKGNVVNPDDYMAKFGTDALRMYLMFLGPVDQGGDFRDTGMEGMRKFMDRVYRMVNSASGEVSNPELDRKLHQLIKKVGEDIENRHYNTSIAGMMEFLNLVQLLGDHISSSQAQVFVQLLAPFAPFLAEELYQRLTKSDTYISVHTRPWPQYDAKLSAESAVEMVVQVDGKLRDRLVLDVNYSRDQNRVEQAARASAKVTPYLNGAKFRVIFVPGKIINFVTV